MIAGYQPGGAAGRGGAVCFTMAFRLCATRQDSRRPRSMRARVRLVLQGDGFLIEHIGLTLDATIPTSTKRSSRAVQAEKHLSVVESACQRSRDHADRHVAKTSVSGVRDRGQVTSPRRRLAPALDLYDARRRTPAWESTVALSQGGGWRRASRWNHVR
jgi:hypothetical protein